MPITKDNLTAAYNDTYVKVLKRPLTKKKIDKIGHQFDAAFGEIDSDDIEDGVQLFTG